MTARFNGPLTWSLIAIGATLLAVLLNVPAIARALLMPRANAEQSFQVAAADIWKRYDETEATYLARFEGRSAFFEPRQDRMPPPRARPSAPRDETPTTPPPPPPKTKPRYSGPEPRTLHGDLAIFVDGTRLRVGETKGDLTLVAIEAPWIARVEHRGWEYELSLFARSDLDDFFQRQTKPLGDANTLENAGAIGRAEENVEPVQDRTAARAEANEDRGAARTAAVAETAAERMRREQTDERESRDADGGPDEERDGRAAKAAEVEIPEPLAEGQLESMTSAELRAHLGKLSRARSALTEADGKLKERVDREWKMVLARLREVK
jgi:hypothetical protein